MNVLFFGSTDGTACSLHYFTAMVRLGMTVIPYDPHYFQTCGLASKLLIRLNRGPTKEKVRNVAEDLGRLCKENFFHVIFVMAENFLGADTIEAIRKASSCPPVFVYHSHDNNFSDGICKPKDFFDTLATYDFAFTTKSQNVAKYRAHGQKNSCFIPSAYEPSVHRPIGAEESRFGRAFFDVIFVGTYDHSRDSLIETVGWDKLQVWGSSWNRYRLYREHLSRITAHPIYHLEFADVMSHCRISLGLLREEAQDRHTQRTFEIPACSAFQLAPRNDEIVSFFEEDKEIACFGSLDELKEKIHYYLTHENIRKSIAEAGYRRCINGHHTYVDRVKEMFQIAKGPRNNNFPFRRADRGQI